MFIYELYEGYFEPETHGYYLSEEKAIAEKDRRNVKAGFDKEEEEERDFYGFRVCKHEVIE